MGLNAMQATKRVHLQGYHGRIQFIAVKRGPSDFFTMTKIMQRMMLGQGGVVFLPGQYALPHLPYRHSCFPNHCTKRRCLAGKPNCFMFPLLLLLSARQYIITTAKSG